MIHFASYLYDYTVNLPKEVKREIITESVKVITRTALAILAAVLVHHLELGAMGLCVAGLIGAELSLPTTIIAASFFGGYKMYGSIYRSLCKAHPLNPANSMFAGYLASHPFIFANFSHIDVFSIGILEKHGIVPLANHIAEWALD